MILHPAPRLRPPRSAQKPARGCCYQQTQRAGGERRSETRPAEGVVPFVRQLKSSLRRAGVLELQPPELRSLVRRQSELGCGRDCNRMLSPRTCGGSPRAHRAWSRSAGETWKRSVRRPSAQIPITSSEGGTADRLSLSCAQPRLRARLRRAVQPQPPAARVRRRCAAATNGHRASEHLRHVKTRHHCACRRRHPGPRMGCSWDPLKGRQRGHPLGRHWDRLTGRRWVLVSAFPNRSVPERVPSPVLRQCGHHISHRRRRKPTARTAGR